jgi:hypothetical protein
LKSSSENILFSISALLFSFLFTPLVNQYQIVSYFFVVVSVVFLAFGLSSRQKRHQGVQGQMAQAVTAFMEQQKTLSDHLQKSVREETYTTAEKLLESSRVQLDSIVTGTLILKELVETNKAGTIQIQNTIKEEFGSLLNHFEKTAQKVEERAGVFYEDSLKTLYAIGMQLNESSGKLVGVIEESGLTSQKYYEQQLLESKRMIESVSDLGRNMSEQSKSFLGAFATSQASFEQNLNCLNEQLAEQHKKAVESRMEVVTILKLQESAANDFYDNQLTQSKRITDSITDLENKLDHQSNRLLDSLSDGQQTLEDLLLEIKQRYEEFNDNIEDYQKIVRHASEDIEVYRNDIEEDLKERLEFLQSILIELKELTAQLAGSKYQEREKALQVQKKLTKQFERLMEREFVHSSKD